MNPVRVAWTPVLDVRLRELALRDDHPTYSAIAAALSLEFNVCLTKNACIGRARRVGLPARQPLRGHLYRKEKARPAPRRNRKPPEPVYDRVPIYDLRMHDCRWPIGESPPFLFCGRPTIDQNHPYCPLHTKMTRPGK